VRISRRDATLNDSIEVLQEHYIRCGQEVGRAWAEIDRSGLTFIEGEIDKCLNLRYYLENYHIIKTEHGEQKTLFPFWDHQEILYEAIQEEWDEHGYCRIIVLKPRQTGISVWTAASMLHRTMYTPHSFTMIVAQNDDTSEYIYQMSLNAYANLPWWLKPEWMYKTKNGGIEFQRKDDKERMVDPGLSSGLQVSAATKTTGVAIGRSIRNLHSSEVSRWPNDEVYEADIKPSMNARDAYVVFESTGLGRNGLFYEEWCAAVDGESDMRAVWIPVYKVKKYYTKPLDMPENFELADDEKAFNERILKEEHFSIPDEFWDFRRTKFRQARRKGKKSAFLESYPLTPTEAFQSSGLCAFDRDSLEWQEMNKVCKPLYAGEISLVSMEPPRVNADDIVMVKDGEILPRRKSGRGGKRMHIWEMPEANETYYVSADVALGNGGDYSVCNVYRAGVGMEPDTQVANWWGWIPPKRFAHVIAAIGIFYNSCEVAVEYMKDGITTGNELRDMDYPNLYRPQWKDKITNQASNYLHFVTNSKTRDEIIGCMNEALLDHTTVIRCAETLDEMIDFASMEIEGKTQGQGNNDDSVMTIMIGLYCLRETTKHLKTTASTEKVRATGELHVYGVYDNIMRQRGQYNTQAEAEKMIVGKAGWRVQPILVCNANTLVSPIFDQMGAEHELFFKHGMKSTEITPDVVWAYRSSMMNARPGIDDFGDDW
jgi:hypothetical protein